MEPIVIFSLPHSLTHSMENTETSPEVARMQRRKATIENRLAGLDGIERREAERYPSGAITGRSGRAYAQRQKGAAARVERSIDRAKEYTALFEEKRDLEQ